MPATTWHLGIVSPTACARVPCDTHVGHRGGIAPEVGHSSGVRSRSSCVGGINNTSECAIKSHLMDGIDTSISKVEVIKEFNFYIMDIEASLNK